MRCSFTRTPRDGTALAGVPISFESSFAPLVRGFTLEVETPIYNGAPTTLYHPISDLFAWVMLAFSGVLIAAVAVRERRHRPLSEGTQADEMDEGDNGR